MSPKLNHLAFTVGVFQAHSEADTVPDGIPGEMWLPKLCWGVNDPNPILKKHRPKEELE